jgi:hypothetical protein
MMYILGLQDVNHFSGTPRDKAQHATKWPVVSVSVAAGPCSFPAISVPPAIAILHLT